ncbi:MAG: hypothetical protein M3680_07695 [Myxococcota bacterium]|nr:hypothetical protein [Myxococcota bacterium]
MRHLVELHGGTVTAASAGADQGATFTVTFPRSEASVVSTQDLVKRGGIPECLGQLDGISVDDELDTREMMVALLAECGASASSASSAAEAFAMIAQTPPTCCSPISACPGKTAIR